MAAALRIGHEGVDVNESRIRWIIIISSAAALWVSTALTASAGVALHWYLAIWLATGVVSLGVVACLMDAMARAREADRQAAGRAARNEEVKAVCAAIGENARRVEVAADRHARRVEAATQGHGDRLHRDVYAVMASTWRGEALAASDAMEAAARSVGGDTGPMQAVSGH